jgi:hypothetical protein
MSRRPIVPLLLGALLLVWVVLLAGMAWDRGPDPWVDFGRELYVPWRLTEGDALHRELAWFNGPLSPWWNAGWMWLCGVSFDTLQWVNLGLALLGAALLYALVRAATGALGAFVALCMYFPLFVFSQQRAIGNYSHLAPYSHCIVHGYVLSLAALAAFARARKTAHIRWYAAAGCALGGVFLTKGEIFLAAAGASAVALAFAARGTAARDDGLLRSERSDGRGPWLRVLAVTTAGFATPLVLAWLALRSTLPAGDSLPALLGTWTHALNPDLAGLPFYTVMRGMDAPLENVMLALRVAGGIGGCILAMALLVRGAEATLGRRASGRVGRDVELCALGAAGLALVLAVLLRFQLHLLLRPLPLGLAVVAALAFRAALAQDPARREQGRASLVLAAFSGLLLLKLGLKPSVRDYGFVLAAPGTTLCVAALVHGLPGSFGAGIARGRAILIGALVALALGHVHTTRVQLGRRTLDVRSGGDRVIVTPWRGEQLEEIMRVLDEAVPAEGTLLVLPEGVMINYWLRRRTPIQVFNFMPPELLMFGEEEIIADLEAHAPDVVLLAQKETPEYGHRFFGHGYGDDLLRWIHARYRESARFGAVPLTSADWGAQILVPR